MIRLTINYVYIPLDWYIIGLVLRYDCHNITSTYRANDNIVINVYRVQDSTKSE